MRPSRPIHAFVRYAAACTSTFLVATSLAATEPKPPEVTFEPHTFETTDGRSVAAELGTLRVPERRGAEGTRTIALRFVRFASTAQRPGAPIVYLAGGPGGSGIGAARGTRFPLFQALRRFGDVIAFDQRGTGRSEPDLACGSAPMLPFDRPLDRTAAGDVAATAVAACADRLRTEGVDLDGYTTRESAADLDDLRRALGAEDLTLWGISYGTHLALAYLAAYPDSVDRLVLAGIEALDQTYKLPADQQALLERIAGLAQADPAVRARVPDLLASIARLLAQLERQPARVALTDPRTGMNVELVVGAFDLRVVLASMLRGPRSFAGMPDFVARLEDGDWTSLGLQAAQLRLGQRLRMMGIAMDCASGAGDARRQRIAAQAEATLLQDAINFPFPEICARLGLTGLGDGFREPLRSDVPVLMISGTLDGRTPPSNAGALEPGLSRAHHLVIEGAGHSDPLFLSSPEILTTIETFLSGATPTALRIDLPSPRFVAPRRVAALSAEVLDRYVGSYRIDEHTTRRVMRAGDLLFTRRGERGRPLPIRPSSATTFFYEGDSSHLRFDLDDDGAVRGMTLFQDGGGEGAFAAKID